MDSFNIAYVWLIASVLLVAAEAFGVSGVGLLFAGLGALVTGAAVRLGWLAEDAYVVQWSLCFAATVVWALLLWKPLKALHKPKHGGYQNMIGDTAYVGSNGLHGHKGGEVTWSGTIMKAQLAKHAGVESLDAGTPVEIVEVSGATLIVKPKS